MNMNTIICGNFNIDILTSNSRCERYKKLISSFNLNFALYAPTRYIAAGDTCIDHVLVNEPNLKTVQTSVPDFNIMGHKCISIRFVADEQCNKKT